MNNLIFVSLRKVVNIEYRIPYLLYSAKSWETDLPPKAERKNDVEKDSIVRRRRRTYPEGGNPLKEKDK